MPRTTSATSQPASIATVEVYSPTARIYHWLTVALIAVQIPVGFYMVYRGGTLNIWDSLTNNLYSAHKLIGFIVLWLIAARLFYRLTRGAPADEPTIEAWQKAVSHTNHWAIYALLIAVPIGGWIGVSAYPATSIFGLFNLPALVAPDKAFAEMVLKYHGLAATALAALIALHIVAALFHHFVRKDNVLRRMIGGPR